ncbi:smad nuclear-interacting protein 1-like [Venturia nashicola]|nr:smad nuclear-interacting protein 1-like [Venturia nashicola]
MTDQGTAHLHAQEMVTAGQQNTITLLQLRHRLSRDEATAHGEIDPPHLLPKGEDARTRHLEAEVHTDGDAPTAHHQGDEGIDIQMRQNDQKVLLHGDDMTHQARAVHHHEGAKLYQVAFNGEAGDGTVEAPIVKEKPNFGPSGLLAKESNTVAGTKIVLKYNEPPEARKPPASQAWRMYIFKGDDLVDTVPLHTRSCWLIGREGAVADLLVEHPSTSKQHAVIQFRHSVKVNEFGDRTNVVRPYLLDLESANGTELNGERLEGSRYFEVRDKDMMKIGLSEREYVFMLPPSK